MLYGFCTQPKEQARHTTVADRQFYPEEEKTEQTDVSS
jgi:hypothetical protein